MNLIDSEYDYLRADRQTSAGDEDYPVIGGHMYYGLAFVSAHGVYRNEIRAANEEEIRGYGNVDRHEQ